MYDTIAPESLLSQGDIIDDCPVFGLEVKAGEAIDLDADPTVNRLRVIVLTHACDLAEAKSSRVLAAVVYTAQVLIERGLLKAATIRDQVRRHQVYGWYFLPKAPGPIDLPESIDLRDLHTIPRAVLEHLIASGKRVCRIATPYREHLAQHFAVTYMRIGLSEPDETEP